MTNTYNICARAEPPACLKAAIRKAYPSDRDDELELRLKRWGVWGVQFDEGMLGIEEHGRKQPRTFSWELTASVKEAIAPKLAGVGLCEDDLDGL